MRRKFKKKEQHHSRRRLVSLTITFTLPSVFTNSNFCRDFSNLPDCFSTCVSLFSRGPRRHSWNVFTVQTSVLYLSVTAIQCCYLLGLLLSFASFTFASFFKVFPSLHRLSSSLLLFLLSTSSVFPHVQRSSSMHGLESATLISKDSAFLFHIHSRQNLSHGPCGTWTCDAVRVISWWCLVLWVRRTVWCVVFWVLNLLMRRVLPRELVTPWNASHGS